MEVPLILLVEDEASLAMVVKDSLVQQGYAVVHAADGRKALEELEKHTFALCIMDVMLPHIDGFTLARQVRSNNADMPILFLTARIAISDVVEGYNSGGNDYLRKPFSLDELFMRVGELLRRHTTASPATNRLTIGAYLFVPHKQVLKVHQQEIRLSYREAQLLQLLYENRNGLLERKKVLLQLWGDDSYFHARTMDVFITKLRKHLRHDPSIEIINMRGVGFKLIC